MTTNYSYFPISPPTHSQIQDPQQFLEQMPDLMPKSRSTSTSTSTSPTRLANPNINDETDQK